jgi:hypothetical protein
VAGGQAGEPAVGPAGCVCAVLSSVSRPTHRVETHHEGDLVDATIVAHTPGRFAGQDATISSVNMVQFLLMMLDYHIEFHGAPPTLTREHKVSSKQTQQYAMGLLCPNFLLRILRISAVHCPPKSPLRHASRRWATRPAGPDSVAYHFTGLVVVNLSTLSCRT